MMSEEELRERLRDASADFAPRGDLLESLADEHTRKHKRVRGSLVGGSLVATALVVALLGTLFTGSPPPAEVDPATLSEAEIIQKAKDADVAAHRLIMHFTAAGHDTREEGWALRSEHLGYLTRSGTSSMIARPDGLRTIDHGNRTVTFVKMPGENVIGNLFFPGSGDLPMLMRDDTTAKVVSIGTEIHVTVSYLKGLSKQDLWFDSKTFLLVRAQLGAMTLTYDWLPATAENRELLTHTVPPGYLETVAEKPGN